MGTILESFFGYARYLFALVFFRDYDIGQFVLAVAGNVLGGFGFAMSLYQIISAILTIVSILAIYAIYFIIFFLVMIMVPM